MNAQDVHERKIFNAAPDGILVVDCHGNIVLANPAIETITGYSAADLVGQNVDIFLPVHLHVSHAQAIREYFSMPGARSMGAMDLQLLCRDGTFVPVDISLSSWEDDGLCHAVAFVRDLTERKRLEESFRHQASHDELTGLANRALYRLQLNQALVRADRNALRVAVLFLDLDCFKIVNDSFGHGIGDALLVQVGSRIRSAMRESDTLARVGGDEFSILLTELKSVEDALTIATKIQLALQTPFKLNDQVVCSGASMGLAFYPDDACDSETLLRYAEMAMYQAKQAGRGIHACYSNDLDLKVHESVQLHMRLKEAIGQGLLELHYQPQVGVESGLSDKATLRLTATVRAPSGGRAALMRCVGARRVRRVVSPRAAPVASYSLSKPGSRTLQGWRRR